MQSVFSAEQGMQLLLDLPIIHQTERLSLAAAYRRVLAQTVMAHIPVPPFPRSPYDGYALRSADTSAASPEHPVVLRIAEELPAGTAPSRPLAAGTAVKIFTGAPVPEGADTIIKYEDTVFTSHTVTISHPCKPGNIVPVGEDIAGGAVLASCGTSITGPVMGMLAGQGLAQILVYRRPVVSIISTGSELVQAGVPLSPGKIYGTNFFILGGFLQNLDTQVLDGGTVEDDPEEIAACIRRELLRADLVITTGGASVGDYDYAETVFLKMGAQQLFRRLSFKPGGTMLAGVKDSKVILGLSGNPGAAAVGLLRVAAPYIRKLCGRSDWLWEEMNLRLKVPFQKPSPDMRLIQGQLSVENGCAYFVESPRQANGTVSSLVQCSLLAEIPAGSPPLAAGTMVKAYRIE